MGQVNASEALEAPHPSLNGESIRSNNSLEMRDYPSTKDKTQSCAKNTLDLIIEKCLFTKEMDQKPDVTLNEVNDKKVVQKSEILQQLEQETFEPLTSQLSSVSLLNDLETKSSDGHSLVGKGKMESVKQKTFEGDGTDSNVCARLGPEDLHRPILNARDLLEDDQRCRHSFANLAAKTDEHSKHLTGGEGRTKMATFQTFIDSVLDSSLHDKPVSPSKKVSSIPENADRAQSPLKAINKKDDLIIDQNPSGEKILRDTLEERKSDQSCREISKAHLFSLKDHIERVLEKRFNHCSEDGEEVHTAGGGKSETSGTGYITLATASGATSQSAKSGKTFSPPVSSVDGSQSMRSEVSKIYPSPPEVRSNNNHQSYHQNHTKEDNFRSPMSGCNDGRISHLQSSPSHRMDVSGYYPNSLVPHDVKPLKVFPLHSHDYLYQQGLSHDKSFNCQPPFESAGQSLTPTSSHLRNQFPLVSPSARGGGQSQISPIGLYCSPHNAVVRPYGLSHSVSDRVVSNNVYPTVTQEMHFRDCRCPSCLSKATSSNFAQNVNVSCNQRIHDIKISQGPPQSYIPKLPLPVYSSAHQPNPIVAGSGCSIGAPTHAAHALDPSPAMMRPSNSTIPPGYFQYRHTHKLLPTNPPIASAREFSPGRAELHDQQRKHEVYSMKMGMNSFYVSDNDVNTTNIFPSKLHNEQVMKMYPYSQHQPNAGLKKEQGLLNDNCGQELCPTVATSLPSPRSLEKVFPSNAASHIQVVDDSVLDLRSGGQAMKSGNIDEETPLDLSFKKSGELAGKPRSQSFSVPYSQGLVLSSTVKKGFSGSKPINTFIKQIENSVGKYCNEKLQSASNMNIPSRRTSPPVSEASLAGMINSPPGPSSHAIQLSHANSSASSTPVVGRNSILMGYPNTMSSAEELPTKTGAEGDDHLSTSSSKLSPRPNQLTDDTDAGGNDFNKPRKCSVSKHEPIQKIIGGHNPSDILFLVCRLCDQTYGSPYGFRKHFRNQHGFEPRAEHTIVKTISATKSALQTTPQGNIVLPCASPLDVDGPENSVLLLERPNSDPEFYLRKQCVNTSADKEYGRDRSPVNIGDIDVKEKEASQSDSAVKCLECPECKKKFQLNDFGSYKRHCRQHSHEPVRTAGPYLCTECQTSFSGMHLLRGHMACHINDKTRCEVFQAGQLHPLPSERDDLLEGTGVKVSGPVTYDSASKVSKMSNRMCLGPVSLLPSNLITRSPAETIITTACPDSSKDWDDKNSLSRKEKVKDEKLEETSSTEGNDSGYSPSVLSNDDKTSDSLSEPSCNGDVAILQKRFDDLPKTSLKSDETNLDINGYRHKKFGGCRKRDCPESADLGCSLPKSSKLYDLVTSSNGLRSDSVGSTPSSCCTAVADSPKPDSVRSNDAQDNQETGSDGTDSKCDLSQNPEDSKLILKIKFQNNVSKPEARHNLPFVWNRVTRSKVGRRSKP